MGQIRNRGANQKRWGRNPGRWEGVSTSVARPDTIRAAILATEAQLASGRLSERECEDTQSRLAILRLALERARA